MYNYLEAVIQDIREALNEYDSRDYEDLYESLWVDDSVTGNGSGSYTFNANRAHYYLIQDGFNRLHDVAWEWDCSEELAKHIINQDWEWLDVSIRCHLLSQALQEVLGELSD